MERVNILGVPIAAVDMGQALAQIEAWIDDDQKVDLELKDKKISLRPGLCRFTLNRSRTNWPSRMVGHF